MQLPNPTRSQEAMEMAVESARQQLHSSVGPFRDSLHDGVSVRVGLLEREQDVECLLVERLSMTHTCSIHTLCIHASGAKRLHAACELFVTPHGANIAPNRSSGLAAMVVVNAE